ncbi:MAG: hydrogenase maturation peptidase HycI [Candidatus Margulisbacteria bacterium]|nr:hydrogenase maturation peptidase HycI [Candidatus Margulisiibacteriota bacterium]
MIDLQRELEGFNKLAIIGVGSEIRNDDGVGIYVVNQLKEKIKAPNVECLIGGTVPENLTGALKKIKPSHVLLIDAAGTGQQPGAITLIDPARIKSGGFSTHTLSLKELAAYLEQEIKTTVLVLGIEPKNINFGEELSPEARRGAEVAISLVLAALP